MGVRCVSTMFSRYPNWQVSGLTKTHRVLAGARRCFDALLDVDSD